ncbi:MAG: hypothetical protein HPY53_12485 [Brevinematales bacterium]|nr:hypothetical protein [Brevinematales bacterium]
MVKNSINVLLERKKFGDIPEAESFRDFVKDTYKFATRVAPGYDNRGKSCWVLKLAN